MIIERIQILLVKPPSDTWSWVRVTSDTGLEGWGEFSGNPLTDVSVSAVILHLARNMKGKNPLDIDSCLGAMRVWRYPSHLDNRSIAMAVSALDMALWDLRAKAEQVPLCRLLNRNPCSIGLYANLNRLLRRDRSLPKLLSAAERAVKDGLEMVKIAPFDEVSPCSINPDWMTGVERWRQVAQAIGETHISIDCHCRFTDDSFSAMIDSLGERAFAPLFWEDPVRIHRSCDMQSLHKRFPNLTYASGEDCFREDELCELSACGQFSILNPDLKYIGGVSAAQRVIPQLLANGVEVALHNPSGPVATAHSAHVSALCGTHPLLEFAYGDQVTRDEAAGGAEGVEHGRYYLSEKSGIGFEASIDFLEKHASILGEV